MTEIAERDWFLQLIVDNINGTNNRAPITLLVGGILISGDIISGHIYFELLAGWLAKAYKDAPEEVTAKRTAKYREYGELYTSTKSESDQLLVSDYIHLTNAQYFLGAHHPIPPSEGNLWRGRISQVDGFNLGSLRIAEG